MTGKTHLVAGLLAGEIAACCLEPTVQVFSTSSILLGAAVGSLLPDIDHPGSTISRRSLFSLITSTAVSAVTRHRGFTHTPVFLVLIALIISIVSFFYSEFGWNIGIGILVGIVSHYVMDSLNPGGIMWLYPFSTKHYHLTRIRTGSATELIFFGALCSFTVLFTTKFFPDAIDVINRVLRPVVRTLM